jgi:hypothetical protein
MNDEWPPREPDESAESLIGRGNALLEIPWSDEHNRVASTLDNWTCVLCYQEAYVQAERTAGMAVKLYVCQPDSSERGYLLPLKDWAELLLTLERFSEAERILVFLLNETLKDEKYKDYDWPNLALQLACLFEATGRPLAAEIQYRKMISSIYYSPKVWDWVREATGRHFYAQYLFRTGREDEAHQQSKRISDIWRARTPVGQPPELPPEIEQTFRPGPPLDILLSRIARRG